MGLLGGGGFSLPIADSIEVIQVDITITDSAKTAMSAAMGEDSASHALVISADSGGCSGFMYDMQIIEKPDGDGWQTIEVNGVTVMIHDRDSARLDGIRIDHRASLMGAGFQIDNPNADRSCGCGKSFG